MSGDFSTRKPARLTPRRVTLPMRSSSSMTFCAASTLALMLAPCDRSSSTDASTLSLSSSETPPTRSAAFSRSASQRADSSLAPRADSTYTDEPTTERSRYESACTDTNMSACCRARARDALAMLDEVIAVARQHRAHAGLAIDALLQPPRDRQRDVLLARAGFADRAGIDAAVAGIDRDDHVAAVRFVRGLHDRRGGALRGDAG